MKIIESSRPKLRLTFGDLVPGEVFRFTGAAGVCIKTDTAEHAYLSLETGNLWSQVRDATWAVERVDGAFVIDGG